MSSPDQLPEGRPLYENLDHLKAEGRLARAIEEKGDVELFKLPRRYSLDYVVERQDSDGQYYTVAWMELKTRQVMFREYMISLDKVMRGLWLQRETGHPFFLFVRFDLDSKTEDRHCHVTRELVKECTISLGGRDDRGDDQDQEPCLFIPTLSMNKINLRSDESE